MWRTGALLEEPMTRRIGPDRPSVLGPWSINLPSLVQFSLQFDSDHLSLISFLSKKNLSLISWSIKLPSLVHFLSSSILRYLLVSIVGCWVQMFQLGGAVSIWEVGTWIWYAIAIQPPLNCRLEVTCQIDTPSLRTGLQGNYVFETNFDL
jgi:hypothetical protein